MTSALSKGFVNGLMMKLRNRRTRNVLIGLYVLLILGFSATVRATEVRILPVSQKTTLINLEGLVFKSADGRVFLQVSDTQVYELRGKRELANLNGLNVFVQGLEYKHRVGPVYQTASFNPLQDEDRELAVAPVVFVYSFEVLNKK